jgi:hypothetical protein
MLRFGSYSLFACNLPAFNKFILFRFIHDLLLFEKSEVSWLNIVAVIAATGYIIFYSLGPGNLHFFYLLEFN